MGGAALRFGVSRSAAAENEPAFAAILESPIACGRLRGIDVAAARKLPAVLAVVTAPIEEIDYAGQPLGLVVAANQEAAMQAASLCALSFESRPAILTTAAALPSAFSSSPDEQRGDPDAAIIESQLRGGTHVAIVHQTYRTAPEPTAEPLFGIAALLAQAELAAQRKVTLLPARSGLTARPETIQTLTLCAARDGRLRALVHNALNDTAMRVDTVLPCELLSRHLYHADNLRLSHKLVRKNVAPRTNGGLQFPGLAPGLFALESALDELAHLLAADPLWLRRINYAELDEHSRKSWAKKRLRDCYRTVEERSDWVERRREPKSFVEGANLIGLGAASTMSPPREAHGEMAALYGAHVSRVLVTPNGEPRIMRHHTVLDLGVAATPALIEAARAGVMQALHALFAAGEKGPAAADLDVTILAPNAAQEGGEGDDAPSLQAVREVAAAGVAAAVCSALHNASGVRYRELPIAPLSVIG